LPHYPDGGGSKVPPKRWYVSTKLHGEIQRTAMVSYRQTFRVCGAGTSRFNIMQMKLRRGGAGAIWPWVHDTAFCDILINFVAGSIIPRLKCAVVKAKVVGR
jgi:hypothetical protein